MQDITQGTEVTYLLPFDTLLVAMSLRQRLAVATDHSRYLAPQGGYRPAATAASGLASVTARCDTCRHRRPPLVSSKLVPTDSPSFVPNDAERPLLRHRGCEYNCC